METRNHKAKQNANQQTRLERWLGGSRVRFARVRTWVRGPEAECGGTDFRGDRDSKAEPRGFLTGQPGLLTEFQASERLCLQNKVGCS